jgi:excisionase family DNA binding protein
MYVVKEIAATLRVSPGQVYGLVASGKLKCYRIGQGRGSIRCSEEQLAEFLASVQSRKAAAPPIPAPVARRSLMHLYR